MNLPRMFALIAAVTIALVVYRYWSSSQEREAVLAPAMTHESTAIIAETAIETTPAPLREVAIPAPLEDRQCLTPRQFEALPEVIQDAAQMESVSVNGRALEVYENLDEDTLRGFAEQGDSAAMLIIGAINVMRAYKMDDSLAIQWLNQRQRISDLDLGNGQLSSAASLALNDAAFWFYEAAIHGRLLALQKYGQTKGRLFGGPVGLGWITQEEYDLLNETEKSSLIPANVYAEVAFDVAPGLRNGVLGRLSRALPESPVQMTIREDLVTEFQHTLADSGLPPISMPVVSTDIADLLAQICDPE